ncbi:hypothetical protein CXG81DRAFT_12800 [Caulochytrium protostelioides]|uniref:ABC transporter domain-containing protein n=1 Tax=Caulochytrium protostelioides TaxID=1555241 RepID=A0A4P9X6K9_9FUNG|nr:hypothetical protein CXG81DRAFT_12800 [Caulochytrium protostelioides]|eukprot:RKP00808.1 hypothetical protein CXG81DRAFT_12800 [Caulochytrium protostelioides]
MAGSSDIAAALAERVTKVLTAATSDDVAVHADALAAYVRSDVPGGVQGAADAGLFDRLDAGATNKKSGFERESAFLGYATLIRHLGTAGWPFWIPRLAMFFQSITDKGAVVREAGGMVIDALFPPTTTPAEQDPASSFPYWAVPHSILPAVMTAMTEGKWQVKILACQVLERLSALAPRQVGASLVRLLPAITECLHDTKTEVHQAGHSAMMKACSVINNADVVPLVPVLVHCMSHPDDIAASMETISKTTFVAEVKGPTLSVMVPLLVRAMSSRSPVILRCAVVITHNLCKLVVDPRDAAQFLPQLKPGLDKLIEMGAFAEIRELATQARRTLVEAGGATDAPADSNTKKTETNPAVIAKQWPTVARDAYRAAAGADAVADLAFPACVIDFVAGIIVELAREDEQDGLNGWRVLAPYVAMGLPPADPTAADAASNPAIAACCAALQTQFGPKPDDEDEGDGTPELCRIVFSLAYGTMMLLNQAKLILKIGHRYGVCGANGAGKSTLLRAIAQGKVENFPYDTVRSYFVEHSMQGEESNESVLEFLFRKAKQFAKERAANPNAPKHPEPTMASVQAILTDMMFTEDRQSQPVGALSGGWKMKVDLALAMLAHAELLLLDEPTNHLDVANVQWLQNYLTHSGDLTVIVISHDSGFLDAVCTDIIHYDKRKLGYYPGNLSAFVARVPKARSYYTLSDSLAFRFPPPSILAGINSRTKVILRMKHASYTYAGAAKPSLNDVSVGICLSSRVGIVGPNGAGKSTLMKVLTGEVVPQSGHVDKHPNLRIGYVAQHAFHHLEDHLELTPHQYLTWRYAGGQDQELLQKATRKLSDEEKAQLATPIDVKNARTGEMEKRLVEYIAGRQKFKKSFQYEIKWQHMDARYNTYMTRDELLALGFHKLVQGFDDHEAAREGLGYRELVPAVIRKHFEDVGLDGDIAEHNRIGGLSGGQKVKVVIAAAMWQNPHILIMDEPTNFLDRDALGGLAVAIRDWAGAVVLISHNQEFVGALCSELWHVEGGKLTSRGRTTVDTNAFDNASATETAPSIGREKKRKKKLTRNELKAQSVRRRERHLKWLIEGGPKPVDSDED